MHPSEAIEEGDEWWACAFPERPPNGAELYDARCRPCVLALTAHVIATRADPSEGVAVVFNDGPVTPMFQSAPLMLALARGDDEGDTK